MEPRDELRAIQMQEFRSRRDRALAEPAQSEGAGGEQFLQGFIENLERGNRRKVR
jgi:hypothetical protein